MGGAERGTAGNGRNGSDDEWVVKERAWGEG